MFQVNEIVWAITPQLISACSLLIRRRGKEFLLLHQGKGKGRSPWWVCSQMLGGFVSLEGLFPWRVCFPSGFVSQLLGGFVSPEGQFPWAYSSLIHVSPWWVCSQLLGGFVSRRVCFPGGFVSLVGLFPSCLVGVFPGGSVSLGMYFLWF